MAMAGLVVRRQFEDRLRPQRLGRSPRRAGSCWRKVLPVFNHTIRNNINEFKKKNEYQVSQIVRNLVQNILN
jgi:hypothetical protein